MRPWLSRIADNPNDLSIVLEAYEHFMAEYEKFRVELDPERLRGRRITEVSSKLPGQSEYVYAQWAELKAIVHYLENRVLVATQKSRKFYLEGYNKNLGAHQVENFAKADQTVIDLTDILNHIQLVLDKWEGITKGLTVLGYELKNITALRVAGLEEASI